MKHRLVALTAITGIALSVPAGAQTLAIGTNPQGSLAYTVGAAVARVVTEATGMQVRVLPQGGPDVTIPLVQTGELEFSIASSDIAAAAHAGKGLFNGREMAGVRVVTNLMRFHSGFLVRADSDIHSLADLRGKRLPGEYPQQRVLLGYTRTTLATAGLSLEDVTVVPVPNGLRGVEAFMAGDVDAANFSPGAGIVAQADVAVGGIRFLPVPDTPEADALIREMTPGAFKGTVIPRPNRPGVPEPMAMMTGTFVLLAGAGMPDETVARVVAALRENRAQLVAVFPGLAEMDDDLMPVRVGTVPFHPGAETYFRAEKLLSD